MTSTPEEPDPFRPAAEILAEIQAALDAPRTPPELVTLTSALTLDPDLAWPCSDFCCAKGCPGPGNSLCMTPSREACPGWCTCGYQRVRDVVRALQDVAADATALAWHRQRAQNCRRPRWLPAWGWLHCWSCADSTPRRGGTA